MRYLGPYLNSGKSLRLREQCNSLNLCLVPFEMLGGSNHHCKSRRGSKPCVKSVPIRRGSWRLGIIIYGI